MTPTGMRIWDGTLLRSSTGDTLGDLNKQLKSAMERSALARQQFEETREVLRTLAHGHSQHRGRRLPGLRHHRRPGPRVPGRGQGPRWKAYDSATCLARDGRQARTRRGPGSQLRGVPAIRGWEMKKKVYHWTEPHFVVGAKVNVYNPYGNKEDL